ncbi:MAG TPA: putative toxin-antitoxin system toxin component, PIN family [Terriglobales bacterium]|nr:putative toxin-antitoxin system toxin component, PIN family [Terriglobales bacterium]
MRVVIDTNVMVSGILNPHGPPGRIIDALLSEIITALHDDRVLSEYREVLLRPAFGFARPDVEALLAFMESAGEHINARPLALVLPDPNDLPFLEVATSGHADALITGNSKHFKPSRGKHDVTVISPAAFLRATAG